MTKCKQRSINIEVNNHLVDNTKGPLEAYIISCFKIAYILLMYGSVSKTEQVRYKYKKTKIIFFK